MSAKSAAVAERAPVKVTAAPRVPALMRKCACGGSCAKCGEDSAKKKIQRKASTSAPIPSSTPSVEHVLSGAGSPLDASTRGFMESRFGHDFGGVRVHTGPEAAESARAVGAHAYTVGNDIVFDSGRYDPHSESGKHLLAHELTHTLQQRGMQRSANPSMGTTTPGDAYEAEADAVASRIVSGAATAPFVPAAHAHAPVIARASVTGNQKPQPATNPNAAALAKIGLEESTAVTEQEQKDTRRFISKLPFPLPAEKGPMAPQLWEEKAKAGALESTIDFDNAASPKAGLKQERPSADTLRKIWLTKVGWTAAEAPKKWKDAGGDAESFEPPKAGGKTCDMDHVVELQIGGSNVPENLAPLDATENRASGRGVYQILVEKAKEVRDIYPKLPFVVLHYDSVAKPAGICGPCCKVEQNAYKPGTATADDNTDPYAISAGGTNATLRLPKKAKGSQPIFESEHMANKAGATIIPGMLLDTLQLQKHPDVIVAKFDKRSGTRLPIDVDEKERVNLTVQPKGALKLPARSNLDFTFPYLSKGKITKLELKDNFLAGEGTLEPSIALLRGIKLGIRFSKDELVITTPIPKEKLKSLPGFKVTEADISLQLYPQFNPSGKIAFVVGSEKKPILDGSVVLSAPGGDFTAAGTINANLPGFDTATGDVVYKRSTGWSGKVKLASSKVPGAKSIAVEVGLTEKGYSVDGSLVIGLPPALGKDLELTVKQKPGNRPVYTGNVEVRIPRLDPVKLWFTWDGYNLAATGKTGFNLFGINGKVDVAYDNGKIGAKGRLDFKKGRAAGYLDVELTKDRKFMGEGKLSYQVTDSLIASAGAKLDENEKLTLMGALEFTKPIELFKPSGASYKFFTVGIRIPIPGASIGPVGVQARIEASLSAGYSIGPGELRRVRVEATFNPLEENVDPKLKMSGQLYVGASATVSGEISGSIALDVLVAEVAGGLSVIPSATLKGEFTADALAEYDKQSYSLKADFAVNLGLTLALALTAWAKAKAGVSVFSVETRKDWTLAKFTYDPGLKLGVKAPVHYKSGEPFRLPSADEIVWTKPNIDVQGMLKSIFGSARAEEKEV